MAVCITNRSNVLTNSSAASLERAVCSGSFLSDVSTENEFNAWLEHELEDHSGYGEDFEY
jgi:hypothetical protein